MATKEEFFQAARDKGVSEHAISVLRKWLRPTLHLDTRGAGTRVGHFGGLPRLPADVDWPAGSSLVLTLDCAALPHRYLDAGFPDSGSLLLFGVNEPDSGGEVVYVPAGVETTERVSLEPDLAKIEREPVYATVHWSGDSFPDWIYGTAWATWAKEHFGDSDELAPALREYEERCGDVSDRRSGVFPCGQIGGFSVLPGTNHWDLTDLPEEDFPDDAQDEVAHEEFRRIFPAIAAEALQLVLLATVLTPWFGDGVIAWYIRPEDLAAGRFDEAVVSHEFALS